MRRLLSSVRSIVALAVLMALAVPSVVAAAPSGPVVPLRPMYPNLKVDLVAPSLYGPFDYLVNVSNIGFADAHNVVLEDDLPTDSMLQNVTTTAGSCAWGPFPNSVDVRCSLGTLSPGALVQLHILVHPYRTTMNTTVRVTTTDLETTLADNSVSHSMVLPAVGVSDLGFTSFTSQPSPLSVGDKLTYTAEIGPGGDDDAQDVAIVDLLPRSVRFLDAYTSRGPLCKHATTPFGEAVYCSIGRMGTQDYVTVTIVVEALQPGVVYNTIALSQSTVDPNDAQSLANSATARTWVNP